MLAKLFSEFDIQVIRYNEKKEKKKKKREKELPCLGGGGDILTRCPLGVLEATAIHHRTAICGITRAL